MNRIILAAVIMVVATGVALAAPKRAEFNHVKNRGANAMVVHRDPYDVYVNGRVVGRDPDPLIRGTLARQYLQQSGN